MIDVVWLSYHEGIDRRGYWDQGMLEALFEGKLWQPVHGHTFRHNEEIIEEMDGAVVVIPARHHTEDVEQINAELAKLNWCVVILAGDEENNFPVTELAHDNMKVWVMTPIRGNHEGYRLIGSGWPPQALQLLSEYRAEADERPLDYFFAGQVTHDRRKQCLAALGKLAMDDSVKRGRVVATQAFTKGIKPPEYYHQLASAKVAPCPAGPQSPDSMRLFEALEAGCVPIADSQPGEVEDYPGGYWQLLFGEDHPVPVIGEWSVLPDMVKRLLEEWPHNANKIFAWWQGYKRQLAYDLNDDINALRGTFPKDVNLADQVTVLMPSSPIKSHPSTEIIEQSIASIRHQKELGDCEIIIMLDGVREEQKGYTEQYEEYKRKLLWKCNHEWTNVLPVVFEEHGHQGNITRKGLEYVKTPLVLFVEHDTTVIGDIPWKDLSKVIQDGQANMIRLNHEKTILPDHEHLMLDRTPVMVGDVPMTRTAQWAQRPHLASSGFYRHIINKFFGEQSRTMIEDVMHGVVDFAWRERGLEGWDEFKVFIYNPGGDIQRSGNLDGRKDDPKYDMVFEYDGEAPEGVPRATSERTD